MKIMKQQQKLEMKYLIDKFRSENPGDYFSANAWTWRPIWNFVCEVCPDILTEEELKPCLHKWFDVGAPAVTSTYAKSKNKNQEHINSY